MGVYKNLQSVLGSNPLLWLVPVVDRDMKDLYQTWELGMSFLKPQPPQGDTKGGDFELLPGKPPGLEMLGPLMSAEDRDPPDAAR